MPATNSLSPYSFVADASCVGPSHVATITMKALQKKQQNAPKPIAARLGLLTELIERYGLRDNTGLSASAVMGFAKTVNGFAHTNADVRKKTKALTIAVHAHIGKSVEKYLTSLRPKQLEEYREAWGEDLDDGQEDVENVPVQRSAGGAGRGRGRGRGRGAAPPGNAGGGQVGDEAEAQMMTKTAPQQFRNDDEGDDYEYEEDALPETYTLE